MCVCVCVFEITDAKVYRGISKTQILSYFYANISKDSVQRDHFLRTNTSTSRDDPNINLT